MPEKKKKKIDRSQAADTLASSAPVYLGNAPLPLLLPEELWNTQEYGARPEPSDAEVLAQIAEMHRVNHSLKHGQPAPSIADSMREQVRRSMFNEPLVDLGFLRTPESLGLPAVNRDPGFLRTPESLGLPMNADPLFNLVRPGVPPAIATQAPAAQTLSQDGGGGGLWNTLLSVAKGVGSVYDWATSGLPAARFRQDLALRERALDAEIKAQKANLSLGKLNLDESKRASKALEELNREKNILYKERQAFDEKRAMADDVWRKTEQDWRREDRQRALEEIDRSARVRERLSTLKEAPKTITDALDVTEGDWNLASNIMQMTQDQMRTQLQQELQTVTVLRGIEDSWSNDVQQRIQDSMPMDVLAGEEYLKNKASMGIDISSEEYSPRRQKVEAAKQLHMVNTHIQQLARLFESKEAAANPYSREMGLKEIVEDFNDYVPSRETYLKMGGSERVYDNLVRTFIQRYDPSSRGVDMTPYLPPVTQEEPPPPPPSGSSGFTTANRTTPVDLLVGAAMGPSRILGGFGRAVSGLTKGVMGIGGESAVDSTAADTLSAQRKRRSSVGAAFEESMKR